VLNTLDNASQKQAFSFAVPQTLTRKGYTHAAKTSASPKAKIPQSLAKTSQAQAHSLPQ
jgi:hypothetical protein